MKTLGYSNKNFSLTLNEEKFIKTFLSENGCGAQTPDDLLSDNFSCQCIEDLNGIMSLTKNQIGGYLSSLQEKMLSSWKKEKVRLIYIG